MATGYVAGVVRGLFDAVFQPHRFVRSRTDEYAGGWLWTALELNRLAVVYVVNLALYAIPLTLAGIGVQSTAASPEWFAAVVGGFSDPETAWQFLSALVQNSAFLTVAAVLTLVNYHVAVLLTLNSDGILQTAHTITYSTSAYLAGMFSLVWYLSQAETTSVAAEFVVALQAQFVYLLIDLLGSDLALPSGRPDPVNIAAISNEGQLVIAGLVVCVLYYLYSMYLGARINHGASRFTGLLVLAAVGAAPALYIVGTILAYELGVPIVG
ncbi:hypothetical protein G9C85_12740 [Halorubellus sp. JP-L1]|uniref:hypothetical protein n=1 Tax=Halorubellus sp. JP-L1 TaxID=2715753 RepID=UPI0014091E06|nr:hypothetical protein [Halorubellus sp. JP-L1]NHN42486.1 hypothetical protein [Halorubellus sp. JP-L1]